MSSRTLLARRWEWWISSESQPPQVEPDRSERRFRVFIATSFVEVLRRPFESAQYVSIKYTERLAKAGTEPSAGSVDDSYGNTRAARIERTRLSVAWSRKNTMPTTIMNLVGQMGRSTSTCRSSTDTSCRRSFCHSCSRVPGNMPGTGRSGSIARRVGDWKPRRCS